MFAATDISNILLNVDCYKHTHHAQYPPGTEYISSYIESRGGAYPVTLFFGLQAYLIETLSKPITLENILDAEYICKEQRVPFDRNLWLELLEDHDGYLPVEIEAVPEGTIVPTRNVLVQLVNTDPKYYWVTSFFETALIRAVWYPTTVATLSWMCKQVVRQALERSSDTPELTRLCVHDYGQRGVSSQESAALGGMAHLVNFDQSDTVTGVLAAKRWYNAAGAPGGSGPFHEHAGVCAWGRDREVEAMRRLFEAFGDHTHVGLLTDTFDHDNNVLNILGGELKEQIQSFPGLVLIRGDSGDPVQVVSDTVEMLMDRFGSDMNSKGYKVLPPNIKAVHGDGLTLGSLRRIYDELERRGLAADNALFGMGGGLLQQVNRDTVNFGQKANAAKINGEWIDLAKTPTRSEMKRSKPGRLALIKVDDEYRTVRQEDASPEENLLVPVFRNGKLLRTWGFDEVIARSEAEVPASYYADADADVPAPEQAVATA
jgi:nicotinamide phosphoribosyltransferase